jgi:hypothetical protein
VVAQITGLSRQTIALGQSELDRALSAAGNGTFDTKAFRAKKALLSESELIASRYGKFRRPLHGFQCGAD